MCLGPVPQRSLTLLLVQKHFLKLIRSLLHLMSGRGATKPVSRYVDNAKQLQIMQQLHISLCLPPHMTEVNSQSAIVLHQNTLKMFPDVNVCMLSVRSQLQSAALSIMHRPL